MRVKAVGVSWEAPRGRERARRRADVSATRLGDALVGFVVVVVQIRHARRSLRGGEGRPARRERVRTKAAEREAKRGTHDRRHVLAQIAEFWRSRSRAVSLANLAKG